MDLGCYKIYRLKKISSSRLGKASKKTKWYMVICGFLVHIEVFQT
jgi:hypothetical protein